MTGIKRTSILALLAISCTGILSAKQVEFDKCFKDSTLQLNYIFAGDDKHSSIYFEEACSCNGWYGRHCNLSAPFVRGDGDITVTDAATTDTIYANSFSTLFQEWQHTPEAEQVAKAFEATMVVPFPRKPVNVTVNLYDKRKNTLASITHRVDPSDILIRPLPTSKAITRQLHKGSPEIDCVDLAIVAEGYTEAELEKFFADAARGADAILTHEPFASMKDRFNIMAVATLSGDSGPDVPREGLWNRTAHDAHYDTFYSDRYLTTQSVHNMFESIAGLPAEHIILLVNTPIYGGGGILNQMTVSSSDHPTFKSVLVHEFGHAYAGLADEYYYEEEEDTTYDIDIEPWEPNITTLVDFSSKWADMIKPGTAIPTHIDNPLPQGQVGVYEGAGYRPKGIYRPVPECRMSNNEVEYFCPVCTRAIVGITKWYTEPEQK